MATMTLTQETGAREFVAPFHEPPLPDWFQTGTAELVIRTEAPGDRPVAVAVRYQPTTFEFQAWAPRLVEKHGLGVSVFDLARGLDQGAPVVTVTARPERLAGMGGATLADLDDLSTFFSEHLELFASGGYVLDSVTFG